MCLKEDKVGHPIWFLFHRGSCPTVSVLSPRGERMRCPPPRRNGNSLGMRCPPRGPFSSSSYGVLTLCMLTQLCLPNLSKLGVQWIFQGSATFCFWESMGAGAAAQSGAKERSLQLFKGEVCSYWKFWGNSPLDGWYTELPVHLLALLLSNSRSIHLSLIHFHPVLWGIYLHSSQDEVKGSGLNESNWDPFENNTPKQMSQSGGEVYVKG